MNTNKVANYVKKAPAELNPRLDKKSLKLHTVTVTLASFRAMFKLKLQALAIYHTLSNLF